MLQRRRLRFHSMRTKAKKGEGSHGNRRDNEKEMNGRCRRKDFSSLLQEISLARKIKNLPVGGGGDDYIEGIWRQLGGRRKVVVAIERIWKDGDDIKGKEREKRFRV
ncbi:hypothetical protein L2E82_28284 [Cichorium intybus]|uniref:Uncharacterized protein n=1 Tax=Cichorium intybus TaxID=13427 RepID=A0ACB9CVL1_CICIN|nr:hypothetical protein L2E82_28284 [Cichorium intybus]